MGVKWATIHKFLEPKITIDFSFLQHNKYGFQTITDKTQSRIFAHFMIQVKNNLSYLDKTKRPRDFKHDIFLKEMSQHHKYGHLLIDKQIEHFCVDGYRSKGSLDVQKKCQGFRIFGIRLDTVFFIIRIDPEHRYDSWQRKQEVQ